MDSCESRALISAPPWAWACKWLAAPPEHPSAAAPGHWVASRAEGGSPHTWGSTKTFLFFWQILASPFSPPHPCWLPHLSSPRFCISLSHHLLGSKAVTLYLVLGLDLLTDSLMWDGVMHMLSCYAGNTPDPTGTTCRRRSQGRSPLNSAARWLILEPDSTEGQAATLCLWQCSDYIVKNSEVLR